MGKQTIHWPQCHKKGTGTIRDLYEENTFMSFNELIEKFNLEGPGHLWQYLPIRDYLRDKLFSG